MRSVRFRAYEHERLIIGQEYRSPGGDRIPFEREHFDALACYQERTATPALSIGHRSIRLGHHVGFLRVGPVSLEVYPKLGSHRPDEDWRGLMLHMLRVVAGVRIAPQEQAPLRSRAGDLFELLVRRFLDLTNELLREGLARSYREIEENGSVFRGRLLVGEHLRANHVRRERVFVAYEVHDADNLPNRILRRALERVQRTATSMDLVHRAEAALDGFPDVSTAPIREAEWSALKLDRRTERYREALDLARLILREERPDLRWGDREILALMFDMNALFEAYLERALKGLKGVRVRSQAGRWFWKPGVGGARVVRPDLLVFGADSPKPVVVDAKWKVPEHGRPADEDLRQVFAYLHAFGGSRGVLAYPRANTGQRGVEGTYLKGDLSCRTVFLDLFTEGQPDLHAFREALPGALGLSPVVTTHTAEGAA